ncbi:transcription elongation factor [Micromonospora luteifusca]|uniref:Transcription elongation factor n=1 Tax=Micromonospora luteifusca TaxID=709860 RepID=A0ABS2LQ72_9ACTN|nr:transcription elongation factor [Micromonospora luteifusca]
MATSVASSIGSRTPRFDTSEPSPIVEVTDAAAASATNGDVTSPGWSAASRASKPAASARRASSTQLAASVGVACREKVAIGPRRPIGQPVSADSAQGRTIGGRQGVVVPSR